jgi:nitrogen regulatory protein P-II 1
MQLIIAVVKPYLAEQVLAAVKRLPVEACAVVEVKGYGRQKSYLDQYSESEFSQAYLPKVEIRVWVNESQAPATIQQITDIARTGRMGDGKIFCLQTVPGTKVIEF